MKNLDKKSVTIIGAGPAGTIAAAYLLNAGIKVSIVEKMAFPRFVIGESLLPQCMDILKECELLHVVEAENFQLKEGADFYFGSKKCIFSFAEKSEGDFSFTYQVERSKFDNALLKEVIKRGANYYPKTEIIDAQINHDAIVKIKNETGSIKELTSDFILDASGYGRVLANCFQLNLAPELTSKISTFTHLKVDATDFGFNRNHIAIISHPDISDCWFWLIPLENQKCSLGATANFEANKNKTAKDLLFSLCADTPQLTWVREEMFLRPINQIENYTKKVKSLFGTKYALLGNAGDFLDPIFSSGVTVAAKSAQLATKLVIKEFEGKQTNWENEYEKEMQIGLDVFKTYIQEWYKGNLNRVFYHEHPSQEIKANICSILAGYVWSKENPMVQHSERKLRHIIEVCSIE